MLALIASLVLVAPPAPQSALDPAGRLPTVTLQQPAAPPPGRRPAPPIYTPTADPKEQIAAALERAKEDGIRVLLSFGANDDEGSKAFAEVRRNPKLSLVFADEYRSVNVDVGALDRNLDVAATYGVTPKAGELPALAVLDGSGKVVARADGTAFRSEGDSKAYDPAKLAAFLKAHQAPPPPDAQPVFDAALQQSKREGKSLFVWFSAPW